MKAFVFTDEALREQAGQFVWLELNTDRSENAEVRDRLGVSALPTYFVLDPESETVLLRWIGGTSVEQLQTLLAGARESYADLHSGALSVEGEGSGSPDDLLARADLLYGAGNSAEAAALYERAIAEAPQEWASRSRAVEALLLVWLLGGSCDQAAPFARSVYPELATTSSAAIVASVGLDCSLELPEDHAEKESLVAYFDGVCREVVANRSIPMAADDRSGIYISLLSARKAAEDSTGAGRVATEWLAFLEEAAAAAPTPEARAVFDSHRLSACREIGQPERALEMLRQSERDFPDDYNHPARLAVAYRELGQIDEALSASARAVELAYGPRLVSLLQSRAALFLAQDDSTGARGAIAQALEAAKALPEGERTDRTVKSLEEKLASFGALDTKES